MKTLHQNKTNPVADVWCGYKLTEKAKKELTRLTLREFLKPKHKRRTAYQLYKLAIN